MGVHNIFYAAYLMNYAEVFECRRLGRRRFGLSTFRLVDVSVCQLFGFRRYNWSTF